MAWNVSRRSVMRGSALGAAVAGLGIGHCVSAKTMRKIIVVEETDVSESRVFADTLVNSGCVTQVVRIDRSLNALLQGLEATDGLLVGLTSDPAALIAEQILVRSGARPLLNWTHQYRDMRWEHLTQGAPELLAQASVGWPTVLAHQMQDALVGDRQESALKCASRRCGLDVKSPGMLVSWAFEVGEQPS